VPLLRSTPSSEALAMDIILKADKQEQKLISHALVFKHSKTRNYRQYQNAKKKK
jgi:hypothetical protein